VSKAGCLQGVLEENGKTGVAIWAVIEVGEIGSLFTELDSIDPVLVSMTNGAGEMGLLGGVALWFLIGLGYFGNPHVLSRFLAIDSSESVRKAMFWSGGAQLVVTTTSIFIGLSARLLLPEIGNAELAFPMLATTEFPAAFGGLVLVSALGLIMSTADSQLLISGTAVSRDFIERTLGVELTDQGSERVARAAVGVVGLFGIWVAALEVELVLWLIAFGWTALGASFGPALLASLWWERATKQGVLASMLAGGLVSVVAHQWMTRAHWEGFIAWNLWPFVASFGALVVVSLLTRPDPGSAEHLEEIASGE
jgi:sodium/proline symporter